MSYSFRAALAAIAFTLFSPGLVLAKAGAGASAPATLALESCSWDRPGVNPFMGDVVAAVDRYRDIPPDVRERLKARMAARDYDDMVSIRRDSIIGHVKGRDYGPTISEMHFGTHQLCRSVTRASWSPAMQERGLVYCESGQCILVPTVCRNVSRISRREVSPDHAEASEIEAPPEMADSSAGADPLSLDRMPSFAVPMDGSGPVGLAAPTLGPADSWAYMTGSAFASAADVAAMRIGAVPGPVGGSYSVPLASNGSGDMSAVAAVPEPQSWALLAVGLVALLIVRRRAAAST